MSGVGKLAGGRVVIEGVLAPGAIKEWVCPTLTYSMLEVEALGMAGAIELPLQLEVMEAEITWQYLPQIAEKAIFDPVNRTNLTLNLDQQISNANGTSFESIQYVMSVTAKEIDLGTYAATDAAEPETTHVCHYFSMRRNGATVIEVNPYAADGITVRGNAVRLF